MQRRKFSREFKLEAVKLIRERGVTVAQAARDLDVQERAAQMGA
jgi:transposase